jgi:hypothetical protein
VNTHPWTISRSIGPYTKLSHAEGVRRHGYAMRILASRSEAEGNDKFARAARAHSYGLRIRAAAIESTEKEN